MALHNSLSSTNMHTLIRWTHADEAARLAEAVTAADIGKISRQIDTSPSTYWILDNDVGPVWLLTDTGFPLQAMRQSASVALVTTHWRTHPQTTGFSAEIWNFSSGVNTADPAMQRVNNALYLPRALTVDSVDVVSIAATATATIGVELWQAPISDGDIVTQPNTQVAEGSWTWDAVNKVFIKQLTILDPNLLAGSQLQYFVESDEIATAKFNFTLYYRETAL